MSETTDDAEERYFLDREEDVEYETVELWFIMASLKARLYCKHKPTDDPLKDDTLWVPMELIQHTTKRGSKHEVTLPEWFLKENDL